MAKPRWQVGEIRLRKGKRRSSWYCRWRVDVVEGGEIVRPYEHLTLSTADYPTKRAAQQELAKHIAKINDPNYRARPTLTLRQFTEMWIETVLPTQKPSSQSSAKCNVNRHILPALGGVKLKDLNGMMLQRFASRLKLAPKSVSNVIMTLRSIWNSATDFDYVGTDPFKGLKLKQSDTTEQPCYSDEDTMRVILAAESPYNVIFWMAYETGIRRGEICALDVGDIDLANGIIHARRSRWGKHITDNKSRRPRRFSISADLAEQLRLFVEGREKSEPLFLTKVIEKKGKKYGGKRLHPDNFVKRELKPLLNALGLEGGMHAFRHGNATWMDVNNVPMKVRQDRLGHIDPKTTMRYTHSVDDRNVSGGIAATLRAAAVKIKEGAVQ